VRLRHHRPLALQSRRVGVRFQLRLRRGLHRRRGLGRGGQRACPCTSSCSLAFIRPAHLPPSSGPAAEKESLFDKDHPAADGEIGPALEYCISEEEAAIENAKTATTAATGAKAAAGTDLLSQVLCISSNNSNKLGSFLLDPEEGLVATDAMNAAVLAATPPTLTLDRVPAAETTDAMATAPGGLRSESYYTDAARTIPRKEYWAGAPLLTTGGSGVLAIGGPSAFGGECGGQTVGFAIDSPVGYDASTLAGGGDGSCLRMNASGCPWGEVSGASICTTPACSATVTVSGASAACGSANEAVELTLTYSTAGAVTAARVDTVAGTSAPLRQRWTVRWELEGDTLAAVALSGNPGYRPGLPVRARATNDTSSVLALGLGLPAAGADGGCDAGTATSVGFGVDTATLCRVAGGSDACAWPPADWPAGGLQIGKWGDSAPSVSTDWIDIAAPTDRPADCAGINVELLTAAVGYASSPEREILAARAVYLARPAAGGAGALGTGTSGTELRLLRATFLPLDQSAPIEISKSTPPLFNALPCDVLEPIVPSGDWAGCSAT